MRHYERLKGLLAAAFLLLLPLTADADDLYIHDEIHTYSSLTDTTVYMTGTSELHITSATNPIPGCQINLNSQDSWFFLEQIKPSVVVSTYLSQVRVDGSPAVLNSNVRVDEYVNGAVVIPHAPGYQPLQIYSDFYFGGSSMSLGLYTYYKGTASLGAFNDNVCSFKLKRGYMATFAQDESGTGRSRTYVAQDSDLNVEIIPEELSFSISFIRVFPWRWSNKKGWVDWESANAFAVADVLICAWLYDWKAFEESTQNMEYIPMRYKSDWPDYSNINNKHKTTAALAFNEPDKADQADMTVEEVIAQWPNMMASGLRIGSPATSDGGLSWLYDFIDQADALDYRVDFVAIHCYHGCYTGSQWYNWLKQVHDRTGRPLWVTEWNNGCNWITECVPASQQEQADKIAEFIGVMDNAPFIERYSVYNWCTSRELVTGFPPNPIVLTLAGEVYRDNQAPMAYVQPPTEGTGGCAYYQLDSDTLDVTSYGNHGIAYGGASYTTGHIGQAINLDGSNDYVELPINLADGTDFTFAAWVYWDGGGIWQRIFDFGASDQRYMFLTPRTDGNMMRFAISIDSYHDEQIMETTQLASGTWRHLAVTIKDNTGKLFVSGSAVATNTSMTLNPSDLKTLRNYLGRSQFTPDPYFNGRLDEVIIADYALTDTQIANLAADSPPANYPPAFTTDPIVKPDCLPGDSYIGTLIYNASDIDAGETLTFSKTAGPDWLNVADDGRLTGTPGFGDLGLNSFTIRVTDTSAAYDEATLNITVVGIGLKTHYKFEGNANDSIGSKHGTVAGTVSYPAGKIGQAIDLDGSSGYVTLPADLVNTDDITIAAWVNWDGGDIWQRIFDFGNNTTEYMFLTPRSGGGDDTLRFAITTAGNGSEQRVEVTSSYLPTGQWRHVAVTLEGDVGRLYVIGSHRATNTGMSLNPTDFNPAINLIGKSQWPDPLFNGRIDDFRIYNFALSGPDIATLAAGNTNNPPSFIDDPFSNTDAIEDADYSGLSISANAFDLDGGYLTFSKAAGPDWLQVAGDGSLSGKPSDSDVGENTFTVRADNTHALFDTAQMTIDVLNIYSGVRGLEDAEGLKANWLSSDCPDTPACGGADLNGDKDVDFRDFARLADKWFMQ